MFRSIVVLTLMIFNIGVSPKSFALGDDASKPFPHILGPNCWNQALINSKLLKIHRYTSPREFNYLLTHHCVRTQTPEPGSLGRMTKDGQEYHAFTWISKNRIHAKNSLGAFETPEEMSFEQMFQTYPVKPECINPSKKVSCDVELTYYNCKPLQSKIITQQKDLEPAEQILNDIVYSLETLKEPEFRRRCNTIPLENRILKLNELSKRLSAIQNTYPMDASYLATWLDSVLYQVEEIEGSSISLRCLMPEDNQKKLIFSVLKDQIHRTIESLK